MSVYRMSRWEDEFMKRRFVVNQSINQDILNAPVNKYHVGAHGKMNGIKIKLNGNKCTTKKLICICIRFWKKESFQFVPKTADGEYRITQILYYTILYYTK